MKNVNEWYGTVCDWMIDTVESWLINKYPKKQRFGGRDASLSDD